MQTAVMCIEVETGVTNTAMLVDELHTLADKHPLAEAIEHILIHPGFPVDIRHNSKISGNNWQCGPIKKIKT